MLFEGETWKPRIVKHCCWPLMLVEDVVVVVKIKLLLTSSRYDKGHASEMFAFE